VARQRLRLIAGTLVEPERFESVFARVMCLVSPEELGDVIAGEARAPLNGADQERIARLVQSGFRTWTEFDGRFAEQQRRIRQQNPGLATWEDVHHLLLAHGGARTAEAFTAQRFTWNDGQIDSVADSACVLTFTDGQNFACGDYAGTAVYGSNGQTIPSLGLNLPHVADLLRRLALPGQPAGAAHLRWPADRPLPAGTPPVPFGVLVFLRQTVRADPQTGWVEQASQIHVYLASLNGDPLPVEGEAKGCLLRGLFAATIRTKPESAPDLTHNLEKHETRLTDELRRPTEGEIERRLRHAVIPLAAAVLTL
jgi:hypothetical protein